MNNISLKLINGLKLILMLFVVISFSTDLRVSGTFSVDPDIRPTFQLFEFFTLPLFCILLFEYTVGVNPSSRLKREDGLFLLFVAWAIAISYFANDFYHAISRAKDFFLAWVLFVTAKGLNVEQITKVLSFVILISTGWAFFGIMQMFDLDPWMGSDLGTLFKIAVSWKTVVDPISGKVFDSSFAQGIYLYPQDFSYYLLIPLFLSGWLVTKHRGWFAIFIIVLLGLIGSGSKTFYMLALIVSYWFLLRRFGLNRLTVMVTCVGSMFTATVLVIFYMKEERLIDAIGTFIWRMDQWTDTVNMLLDVPYVLIIGHGTELMEQIYSRFNYPNPHNAILYFSIEYGFIGLLLMASFMYSSLKDSCRVFKPNFLDRFNVLNIPWYTGVERFIFGGLVFTLAMALLDDYFVQTQLTAIFMFYLGMLKNFSKLNVSYRSQT